jgi:hypothetical protein
MVIKSPKLGPWSLFGLGLPDVRRRCSTVDRPTKIPCVTVESIHEFFKMKLFSFFSAMVGAVDKLLAIANPGILT